MNKYLLGALAAAAILAAPEMIAQQKIATDSEILARRRAENSRGIDFSAFDRDDLSDEQREYLTFLYAYMPLPDIIDHSTDYFLENIDVALQARREMPWGKDVPEREFRHFVVPLRINDEPLDDHRRLFYDELKDRIKDLPVEEAILEVNHWCHEKATYQPADGRTRSPLQTVGAAIGRCGEESTFTVAALRAVGIPARQVYTPRWAHTDDNHAWVEAYANGRWHFLGACEPEPVLDLGWFNAPASRGVLMHTQVLGKYEGSEEVLVELPAYTDINVTTNYAPTETASVVVVNPDGTPADSARVEFCLYNYGEFYPISARTFRATDGDPVTLEAGLGDLLVWATDGTRYGYAKHSVGRDAVTTVKLFEPSAETTVVDFDLVPPTGSNNLPPVTDEQARINNIRKLREDSIRGAYTSTFCAPSEAAALAGDLGLDITRLTAVMTDARGNHARLANFLRKTPSAKRHQALRLLEVLTKKDRGDVNPDYLVSCLTLEPDGSDLFDEYVMSPRIDNEQISDFRPAFLEAFTPEQTAAFAADPTLWDRWVNENIELVEGWNPARVRILPASVLRTGKADARSREIFYVAGARSFGIPSRIDPISNKTQWADKAGVWHDAALKGSVNNDTESACRGTLKLSYTKTGRIDDPKYYSHFTLSKIVNGHPQLLGYDDFTPWSTTFASPETLDCGEYMLVTGQRMADGSVLSRMTTFTIADGRQTDVDLTMRQDSTGVQVIGGLNAEDLYMADGESDPRSILSTTGRGYYILGILNPTHEPSVHALNDMAALANELDESSLPILMLAYDDESLGRLRKALSDKTMPSTLSIGYDIDRTIQNELIESLKLDPAMLPIFVIADTFNRVVFVSQGYTIGLGDTLLDVIHKIE
ncbi:MAG: transglutaminase domain-containing protein [Clostridium sp.]|nr:transglutaminase domain-containing protein [Clostridium sp.]